MKLRAFLICCIALLALLLAFVRLHAVAAPGPGAGSEPLPPGVKVETLLQGMKAPVAMAFDPSGRLFYTEKTGSVRLFANGVLQDKPVITYNVSTCSERGLLGIAVDPNFVSNHYIYVYYTQGQGPGCDDTRNKVVRFVEHAGVGSNSVDIFTSPQTAGNHNGGSIHFGPDGKLYISIGDSAHAENAQDLTVPNGKMHRIGPDGSMPTDNPKLSQQGALPSIYAYGLRNSFDFTFDSVVPQRIFASENGPDCDDEMNRIEAGLNYGWRAAYPCDDEAQGGADPKYNSIQPLWFLPRGACCQAPTGIIVYTGNQIPQWKNQVFMASYNNALLYHFTLNGDRTLVADAKVLEGIKSGMALANGPDGALYFIQGGGYTDGTLMRFTGPGAPETVTPPVAQPPATVPGSGSHTFPETGRTVSGIFLDYWNGHGGLPQQGFPISGLLQEVSDLNGKIYTGSTSSGRCLNTTLRTSRPTTCSYRSWALSATGTNTRTALPTSSRITRLAPSCSHRRVSGWVASSYNTGSRTAPLCSRVTPSPTNSLR